MTALRVFLFEYLSAGGDAVDPGLRAEGMAMRDALQTDLLAVPDLWLSVADEGPDAAPSAAGHARRVGVRPHPDETAQAFVARQARRHDLTWVIAPETGGLLADLCAAVPPDRWIGCDAASIAGCSSKSATLTQLRRHGLATPLDFESDPDITHWVVKPDDGAGSVNTRRHGSHHAARADASQRRARGEAAVIEPWVGGESLSLSLLVHGGVGELISINRQRLAIDAEGTLSLTGVDIAVPDVDAAHRQRLRTWACELVDALPGLNGFVGIDLVWHATRGPVAIEVNPRVTSAWVGLSAAIGRNLAGAVLQARPGSRTPAGTDGVARQPRAGNGGRP